MNLEHWKNQENRNILIFRETMDKRYCAVCGNELRGRQTKTGIRWIPENPRNDGRETKKESIAFMERMAFDQMHGKRK